MSAGLPGVGLGGLFFIISALLMPLVELVRLARGRSSRERWAAVLRQFLIAAAMVGAIAAIYAALDLVVRRVTHGAAGHPHVGAVPVVSVAVTLGILLAVIGVARIAALALRPRRSEPPREAPRSQPIGDARRPPIWPAAEPTATDSRAA